MNWAEIKNQRDADGNLTDLALACDALEDNGCDCGTDELGTCLACRCEAALKALWGQQVEAHRSACNQRMDRERAERELARAHAAIQWFATVRDEVPRDDITIWLRDQDEAGCYEAADELDAMRKRLSELAEVGTGYSQQTVDALTKERDWLQVENARMCKALQTIERSGAFGATIVAKRADDHACSWCRGMLTPCPAVTARLALEEHSTRLTAEAVDSGANDSAPMDGDGEQR